MRIPLLTGTVISVIALTGCATKVPPAATFDPARWHSVEALSPGTFVRVRYVTGNPPLRYGFQGRIVRVSTDSLEMETEAGTQRLLAARVLRVTAGGRERNRAIPLALVGALAGAALGGMLTAMNDHSDETAAMRSLTMSVAGGLLGLAAGSARRGAPGVVVYSREGSL